MLSAPVCKFISKGMKRKEVISSPHELISDKSRRYVKNTHAPLKDPVSGTNSDLLETVVHRSQVTGVVGKPRRWGLSVSSRRQRGSPAVRQDREVMGWQGWAGRRTTGPQRRKAGWFTRNQTKQADQEQIGLKPDRQAERSQGFVSETYQGESTRDRA